MASAIKESFEMYSHLNSLVEKWSDRVDLVESVAGESLPYEKKVVLAQCLENTHEAIKMTEATDFRDVNGFKMFALDIVTAVTRIAAKMQ